jgi:hypothetical protein
MMKHVASTQADISWARGSDEVEALSNMPKSCEFQTLSGRGFTQPPTEMSTRSIKIMFLGSKAKAGA